MRTKRAGECIAGPITCEPLAGDHRSCYCFLKDKSLLCDWIFAAELGAGARKWRRNCTFFPNLYSPPSQSICKRKDQLGTVVHAQYWEERIMNLKQPGQHSKTLRQHSYPQSYSLVVGNSCVPSNLGGCSWRVPSLRPSWEI